MNKHKFELLLLKNTCAVALPAIAVLLVLVFMLCNYPVIDSTRCVEIGNIENLNSRMVELYENQTPNVKYIANELRYTGFDYIVDGKIKAAYYYYIDSNGLVLILVNTTEPEDILKNYEVKGKIIKDDIITSHIMNEYANQDNLDVELLRQYCSSYVISEPDYPYLFIFMLYLIICSPIIVCVIILCYTMVIWFNPRFNSQTNQLAAYGEIEAIIEDLNAQMKNALKLKHSNVYVTKDYMIVSYLTKTEVIKLDSISLMSKNIVEKKIFFKTKEVYRLTMSDPGKLFYEVDFGNEEIIDAVVDAIRIC